MRNKYYDDGSYNYMYSDNYQVKWGVILHLIRKYSFYKPHILDLGCGNMPVRRWLRDDEVASNTMMEQDEHIVAELKAAHPADTVYCADLERFDTAQFAGRKFNCIIWAGAESEPTHYFDIISKYIEVLDINGILIVDYMATPPESIGERIGRNSLAKRLIHMNGCKLILPYISPKQMSRWPKVGERRIEIFRLR